MVFKFYPLLRYGIHSPLGNTPKFKPMFSDVMGEYQARTLIHIPGPDCNSCSLSVKVSTDTPNSPQRLGFRWSQGQFTCLIFRQGFGFRYVNTLNQSDSYLYLKRPSANYSESPIFNVTTSASDDNKYIKVGIVRKASNDCDTNVITTTHHLHPSTVKYDLFLEGQNATFQTSNWQNDSVVQLLYVSSHENEARVYLFECWTRLQLPFSLTSLRDLSSTKQGHENWFLSYFGQVANHFWGAETVLTMAWDNIFLYGPTGTWMTWNFTTPDPDDPKG